MTTTIEVEGEIRGTKITAFFDEFTEDQSVGIFFGPESIWCETLEGKEFAFTDEEIEPLMEKAIEIARDQEQDYYYEQQD